MAGSMNNRTEERSYAVQGLTKSGLETVHVGKSGDCRNHVKLRRSGVICLGSELLSLIAGLMLARAHIDQYSVSGHCLRRRGRYLLIC